MALVEENPASPQPGAGKRERMRKGDRRKQILLELQLRPHVRISEMAERFGVSTETVRRDLDKLSRDGLVSRAHGGASVAHAVYPDFTERSRRRQAEREAIGRTAAALVRPGDAVMIDSGSTTAQLARFLAYAGTPCTIITNSLSVAMTLGAGSGADVILCPGDYLPSEAAVVGIDTIEFLGRMQADRCLIGASALSEAGVSETVRGFAAVKRIMLQQSRKAHLLVDSEKFGASGLNVVGALGQITSVVVDRPPQGDLSCAMQSAGVEVLVAELA